MCLLFLEFIGTTELLVVLFVALLVLGPHKLPAVAHTLGRALNQARDASDNFKRIWELEASAESAVTQSSALPVENARAGVEAVSE